MTASLEAQEISRAGTLKYGVHRGSANRMAANQVKSKGSQVKTARGQWQVAPAKVQANLDRPGPLVYLVEAETSQRLNNLKQSKT